MKQECLFCKERDISEVVPGLSVDLQAAIESGVVLDTGTIEEFNDIDNPDNIHCRVKDIFQAMELQKAYLQNGRISQSASVGSSEHSGASVSSGVSTSSSGSDTAGE